MKYICRIAWYLGNILSQIVFAARVGWRDGQMLRPGAKPKIFKDDDYKGDAPYGVRS